jgi:hypothetical protein
MKAAGSKRNFKAVTAVRLALVGTLLCPLLGLALSRQTPPTNYDESKVGSYVLPNPLVFNDGQPVRTANDWVNRRRPELLELFAANMFGHSPPSPKKLNYEVWDTDRKALAGKAIRKQVTIRFSARPDGPKAEVLIYVPTGLHRRPPVFLTLSFSGNQTAAYDPAIKLATSWDPRTHERQTAAADTRGLASADTERILARGYAFATVCYTDIEPDFNGGYANGLRPLFLKAGQSEPGPDEWGAIGAWSYGLSRVLDYLEPALRHGDLELFGRRRRVARAPGLR